MSKTLAFTRAGLKRAIMAAQDTGKRVVGVKLTANGEALLILNDSAEPQPPLYEPIRPASKWEDCK